MKIDETKRSHIDEGPLDLLTKSGRAQRRSFKQGQQVSKQAVAGLRNEFARYLGSQGKRNFNQATAQDMIDFLKSKSVNVSDINPNTKITSKSVNDIFTQKVRQTQSLNRPAPATPNPTAPGSAAQKTTAPAVKPSSAYVQTKDAALKLNAKEKRRLIQQLEKSIKPSTKPTVVNKNFNRNQRLS